MWVGGVDSVEASEYIADYFHAHLVKILCNSCGLFRLMLLGFLSVTGRVADLIHLLRILSKHFASNLTHLARCATYSLQVRMLPMVCYPGQQDAKTNKCFTICRVHYRAFLGDQMQWCKDKIEDGPL